jgi:hypothetical protein
MRPHNPTFRHTTVGIAPQEIFNPGDHGDAPYIPALIENRGSVVIHVMQYQVPSDPADYKPVNSGQSIEINSSLPLWAYAPAGTGLVSVYTGIRATGDVGIDSALTSNAEALLETGVDQLDLLALIAIQNGVMLRYFAEWQEEVFTEQDALKLKFNED